MIANTLEPQKIKAKGLHLFTFCDARSDEARNIQEEIEVISRLRNEMILRGEQSEKWLKDQWEKYQELAKILHSKFKVREFLVENITTTVGRAVIARRLSGNTTYTGIVNYTALGTSNTAAVIGDTQLGTETYRKALSSGTYANNIAYLETFFTASEVSGTFQEYGMFIDGTGSANSGQLFNRFLQTVTKSVTETLNVQSTVTFSDA